MFCGVFFWWTSAADVCVKQWIQILSSGIRTSREYCFSDDFLLLFRTFEHSYLHFLPLTFSKQAHYFSFDPFEVNYRLFLICVTACVTRLGQCVNMTQVSDSFGQKCPSAGYFLPLQYISEPVLYYFYLKLNQYFYFAPWVKTDDSPFLLISVCSRIKCQSLRLVRSSRHLQLTRMHTRLICIRPVSSLRCLHSIQCVTVPIFALSLKELQEQTSWFSVEPLSDVHVITLLPSLIKDDYSRCSFTPTVTWSTRTTKRLDVFLDKWKNRAEKSTKKQKKHAELNIRSSIIRCYTEADPQHVTVTVTRELVNLKAAFARAKCNKRHRCCAEQLHTL